LSKAFGDGTGVWLRMQAAYDAWQTERVVDVSGVKLIRAA
jgi:antitoxin HigA-1